MIGDSFLLQLTRKYLRSLLNDRRLLFTLGRIQYYRKPVAIITTTTTGTLAASLLGFGGSDIDKKKDAKIEVEYPDEVIIKQADIDYTAYLIDNVYNMLKRYENSGKVELLWRLARVTCEKAKLAGRNNNDTKRKELMYNALEYINRAMKCEPEKGCAPAHKWYAIIIDYIGEIEGTNARLTRANEVRQHLERSIEIDDSDPTTWHILGVWHYTFADLPAYQRWAAKAIFTAPPESTYHKAWEYFKKAETIRPNFYSKNTWYMAEIVRKMETDATGREKAIKLYQRAFEFPVVTADDMEVHEASYKMLKKLGAAVK